MFKYKRSESFTRVKCCNECHMLDQLQAQIMHVKYNKETGIGGLNV